MGRRIPPLSALWLVLAAGFFALALLMSLRMSWFAQRWPTADRLAMAVMSGYVIFMLLFQWQLGRERQTARGSGSGGSAAGPDAGREDPGGVAQA